MQSPHVANTEPALKTPHHAAQEEPLLSQLHKPLLVVRCNYAAQHVAMSTKILCSRMKHNVRAVLEWILKSWRTERGIDDEDGTS